MTTSPNQSRVGRWWRGLSLTWRIEITIATAGVIVAIVFGIIAVNADSDSTTTGNSNKIDFEIDEFNGEMPRCFTITGAAPYETGKELWLAHRTENNLYYYVQLSPKKSGRWTVTRTVGSGKGDVDFYFYLLQLDAKMSSFLRGIKAEADDGGDGFYRTNMLPPGAEVKAESTATSAADLTPCPES